MSKDDLRHVLHEMRTLYDSRAGEYAEKTRSFRHFPGLRAEVDRFVAQTHSPRRVIDVGCGAGRDSRYLLELGCSVVALDLSIEMLSATSTCCGPGERLRLVQADMSRAPFSDACFDGAWVCASLLHLPSPYLLRTLDELRRILVPGAIAAISMKSGHGEGWQVSRSLDQVRWFTLVDPADFAALMRARGFVDVSVIPSGRHEWFVAEGRRP